MFRVAAEPPIALRPLVFKRHHRQWRYDKIKILMNKLILEIRAGAGGDEVAIFAGDLARMYQKYAAKRGWAFQVLDANETSLNGYKTLIAGIRGENCYENLKLESGVHRVQRIPATERSGRVHTSTASVAVLPEVEPKAVQVNEGEAAVRILHKPTGIVVASRAERSQFANRERAMSVLRAKLYEAQMEAEMKKTGASRKEQIGSADRSEKIRTYNFPDDRITDHRVNAKVHNIEKILDGNLDILLEKIAKNSDGK